MFPSLTWRNHHIFTKSTVPIHYVKLGSWILWTGYLLAILQVLKHFIYSSVLTDITHVSKWISSAIQRRVQELCLSSIVGNSFLPHCLFDCESLTTLTVEMDCILQVHKIRLPNLWSLGSFIGYIFLMISRLKISSSCPILQDLSLMECVWKNIKRVAIVLPKLETLAIDYKSYGIAPQDFLDCEIKIYAQRVKDFDCSGNLTINIILCNFSLLDDACISIMPRNLREQEVGVRGFDIFEGVHNTRSLTIHHGTLKVR